MGHDSEENMCGRDVEKGRTVMMCSIVMVNGMEGGTAGGMRHEITVAAHYNRIWQQRQAFSTGEEKENT